MKIIGIKQYYWRRYHYVKVETDEDIYGFGEATLRVKQPAIAEAIDLLGQRLIGQDVFSQEWNFNKYFGYDRWRGGVVVNTAMAALDVAIWDAIGKRLNEPVCNLFGGKVRDAVPLYASGWAGGHGTEAELKERANRLRQYGFTAFKGNPLEWTSFSDPYRNYPTRQIVDEAIDRVCLWREILGNDIELSVDLHGRLDYDLALRFMHGVEQANVYFVEEPLIADDVRAYAKLRANTSVPLAAGERLFTRYGHRQLLEGRVFRVAQPDFAHCCGLAEAKKMAANAELFDVMVAPHNSNSSASSMAAIHVDATLPNLYKQEYLVPNLETDSIINLAPLHIVNGCVSLEDALPGIGFIPNFDILSEQAEPAPDLNDW